MIRSMILGLMISASPLQDGNAQYALNNGMRYLNGTGVVRDHHRALVWFYIADALDHTLARPYIGLIEPYITPEQIGHARVYANRCILDGRQHCNLLMQCQDPLARTVRMAEMTGIYLFRLWSLPTV